MKTTTLKVRWDMTKAEAEVVTDAMDMASDLVDKGPVREEIRTERIALGKNIKRYEMVSMELSVAAEKEILGCLGIINHWMKDQAKDPDGLDTYNDAHGDALIALVAHFKL